MPEYAPNGEHGGRVLRGISVGGIFLPPGTVIPADRALRWPEANRRALASVRKVEWFNPPAPPEAPEPPALKRKTP